MQDTAGGSFPTQHDFTWGLGGLLYDTFQSAVYTPGLSQRVSGADAFFHTDWLGSTRYLSDNTGNTFPDALRYDAFGQRTDMNSPWDPTPFQFAGAWGYQSEFATGPEAGTGLQYLQQRYYDPATGRFISADPIGLLGGPNPYAYSDNDPVNKVDPSGLQAEGEPFESPEEIAEDVAEIREIEARIQAENERGFRELLARHGLTPEGVRLELFARLHPNQPSTAELIFGGPVGGDPSYIAEIINEAARGKYEPNALIRAARYLVRTGHRVEFRVPLDRLGRPGQTSDFLVNGQPYDVYSPQTDQVGQIVNKIIRKNNQAVGILLDLNRSSLSQRDLPLNLLYRRTQRRRNKHRAHHLRALGRCRLATRRGGEPAHRANEQRATGGRLEFPCGERRGRVCGLPPGTAPMRGPRPFGDWSRCQHLAACAGG